MAEEARSSKKGQRKSYTREEKLTVVSFYKENNSNLYRTCQQFDMNSRLFLGGSEVKKISKSPKEVLGKKLGSPYNKPAMN